MDKRVEIELQQTSWNWLNLNRNKLKYVNWFILGIFTPTNSCLTLPSVTGSVNKR